MSHQTTHCPHCPAGRVTPEETPTYWTIIVNMKTARDYAKAVGMRLREVRSRHGLSLAHAAQLSQGSFTAVTLRAYECAERSLSVAKLAMLAAFYGIPVANLLPDSPPRDETLPVVRPRRSCGSGRHVATFQTTCDCRCHRERESRG